ncbi:hypothetical protein D7I44_07825 [Gryllotalpicola protaetiae]|uniref:Uncharacterized protein n=1 Tax=Gryllotalpicola protaetiae TaxID=2419771 RepID=A0A387BHZ8_9MICO|nr:hypothetical protein D7I44_07825 [Gryllotalpicola protaetiae]
MVRRVLLVVLALGVLFGLAGMHEVISGPNAAASAVAAHLEHAVGHAAAHDTGPMAHAAVTAPMGDMSHAMETCCMALVVMLALAMLAAPGLLGTLTSLRPRAQIAPADSPRPVRGIERNLTLGVLRI